MCVYTIYTRPLSVQAQYSTSCPIISSSCYNGIRLLLRTSVLERSLGKDRVENTASNSCSVVVYVSVVAGTCLPSYYLATAAILVPLFNFPWLGSIPSECNNFVSFYNFLYWPNSKRHNHSHKKPASKTIKNSTPKTRGWCGPLHCRRSRNPC
jgi:hypothetical protein